MKCLRCGKDSKYPERQNGRCPGCQKPFAFEPRRGDPLTDAAFQAAIDRVSSGGTVRFCDDHLKYEVARRLRPRTLKRAVGAVVASGIAMLWMVGSGALPALALLPGSAGAGALFWALRRQPRLLVDIDFTRLWTKWRSAHGAPAKLIERRSTHPYREPPPDIGNYSFDRAVLCDRETTADLLLGNNFHFENNCAVLSVTGYPPGAFELVRRMLRQNPRLEIFVLHDATKEGCTLAHRLGSDPDWFPGYAIVDVGLHPSQAAAPAFTGLLTRAAGHVRPEPGIGASDAAWLSQYSLELAAIRPEQVLKRLFRAITAKEGGKRVGRDGGSSAATGDGGYAVDDSSFSSDADASDGGADSFG